MGEARSRGHALKEPKRQGGLFGNSLSGRIYLVLLGFTMAVMLAFSLLTMAMYYFAIEGEAEEDLLALAHQAADRLNETPSSENVPALEQQLSGDVRYTLVGATGEVLFDSTTDAADMENHADRPEIKAALESGEGAVSRYSTTLGTVTVYAAVELSDGSVVRLSETRESLLSYASDLVVPEVMSFIVAAILVLAISRVFTRRIMRPIDAIDVTDPLNNDIYVEMEPLLQRIDEQQTLLKEQNAELARAESMRREFSANVSHEMKTPLQVISGYAELMRTGMVDAADVPRFAGLIYDESANMRQLINDVLTLSRLDETAFVQEPMPVDLMAVAERVVARLGSFAETRSVTLSCSGEHAIIKGTETLIEEAVYNLVENGIRYNHPGGHVGVDVRYEYDINDFRFALLRVSDDGPGIPPEEQGKVFERFYRMEKSRSKETGGTGLGLAIAKHAALNHRGTLTLSSKVGRGTTFTLRIPSIEL